MRGEGALRKNREKSVLREAAGGIGEALPQPGRPAKVVHNASPRQSAPATPTHPASFANGRYAVKRFLGEGGKKRVYLAQDTVLDRDVVFTIVKTEGLDDTARTRITREAPATGRKGDHPHIMPIFDLAQEPPRHPAGEGGGGEAQPYMTIPLMGGGDVEGLIKKAPNHQLSLPLALDIALAVARGLAFAHGKGIIHRDIKLTPPWKGGGPQKSPSFPRRSWGRSSPRSGTSAWPWPPTPPPA